MLWLWVHLLNEHWLPVMPNEFVVNLVRRSNRREMDIILPCEVPRRAAIPDTPTHPGITGMRVHWPVTVCSMRYHDYIYPPTHPPRPAPPASGVSKHRLQAPPAPQLRTPGGAWLGSLSSSVSVLRERLRGCSIYTACRHPLPRYGTRHVDYSVASFRMLVDLAIIDHFRGTRWDTGLLI